MDVKRFEMCRHSTENCSCRKLKTLLPCCHWAHLPSRRPSRRNDVLLTFSLCEMFEHNLVTWFVSHTTTSISFDECDPCRFFDVTFVSNWEVWKKIHPLLEDVSKCILLSAENWKSGMHQTIHIHYDGKSQAMHWNWCCYFMHVLTYGWDVLSTAGPAV